MTPSPPAKKRTDANGGDSGPAASRHDLNDLPPKIKARKTKLELGGIVLTLLVLVGLTIFQRGIFDLGPALSRGGGVVTLFSINLSILFLGLLIVLVLRNLYRIFFERQGLAGRTLRTKLVIAFISLSLVPTIIIFQFSYMIISSSHDLLFNDRIQRAMADSLALSEAAHQSVLALAVDFGEDIVADMESQPSLASFKAEEMGHYLNFNRPKFHFSSLEFYDPQGRLTASSYQNGFHGFQPLSAEELETLITREAPPWSMVMESPGGDLTRIAWPVKLADSEGILGFLVAGRLNPLPIQAPMKTVRAGLEGFRELNSVKRSIRFNQMLALAGATILSIFLSTWIGAHLAGNISGPLIELVRGTQRVAQGDLDFRLTTSSRTNEFSILVASFNQMTQDLKTGYAELDQRRQFMATLLDNISTGVVALDQTGRITSFNRVAQFLLRFSGPPKNYLGATLGEAAPRELLRQIDWPLKLKGRWSRPLSLNPTPDRTLSLHFSQIPLKDDQGREIGYLMTFEDLTELEKAQRLSAWREVARRIAHEIKNPLTPIQLAAQRLRRRFAERLSQNEDGQVFDECTQVIIRQVDDLKNLVSEFSQFARLPEIKPRLADLGLLVEEVLSLYRQAHKKVVFDLNSSPPPPFYFDPTQMRQVLNNLLDNAVAAVNRAGHIEVGLGYDQELGLARLTIADDGPGLKRKIKDRLFEPYVTTKEGGQGLGLVIVKTIVTDHEGFIRVADRPARGAEFIIELPVKTSLTGLTPSEE